MAFFLWFLAVAPAWSAAVPNQITYQGTLKEQGAPVDGTRFMQFRITNVNGSSCYWKSAQTAVPVTQGLFAAVLNPAIPSTDAACPNVVDWQNVTPYIELSVAGQVLGPLRPITATAYSLMSANVVDGAITRAKINTTFFESAGPGLVPVGVVLPFAGSTEPKGFFICDGRAVSRTTDADLFSAIGITWGNGDGASTYNIPDLRGRAPIGAGPGDHLTERKLGDILGEETHTLFVSEIPSHTHLQDAHNHDQNSHSHTIQYDQRGAGTGTGWFISGGGPPVSPVVFSGNASAINSTVATNIPTTATNQNTGGGGPHNNMQPSLVLNYIIKR